MWHKLKRWKQERIGEIKPSLNAKLAWGFVALFAAGDFIGVRLLGFKVVAHDYLADVLTVALLLSLTFIYTYLRKGPRIAEMTHMAAVFLSFTAVTATASYLIAAAGRPLIDSTLVAADHALGFDWLASYKWVKSHAWANKMLWVAYSTLIPQIILLLLSLNFRGRCGRGWELIWLFMVSCAICELCSGLWPAAGAFSYYHTEVGRGYVQAFLGLRDGTIRVIGDTRVQGIIQFPSFHMALGMLLTYVARGMPILFIFLLEVNILLFISTPSIGGHHFADLWGGIALALVSILIVRRAFAAGLVTEPEKITSM